MSSDVSSIFSQDNLTSTKPNGDGIYEFENFRLDVQRLMLYRDSTPVPLAPKVIETLIELVRRRGDVVSKQELMNSLWADSFVEESNLTQNIYLLRRALGKGSDGRDLIETFRRRGYRFTGDIRDATAERAHVRTFSDQSPRHEPKSARTPPIDETKDAIENIPASRGIVLHWGHAIIAAVILLIGVAALSVWQLNRESSRATVEEAAAANISLKRLTPDLNARQAAISPDGKYLVYTQLDNENKSLWIKDIATGGAKQIMPMSEDMYGAPQISPDGTHVYFTVPRNNRNAIVRIPFAGGDVEDISPETTSPFIISPDGKQIAFVRDQNLTVAAADGSGERIVSRRGTGSEWFESWGSQLSWSPDGSWIAVCGGRIRDGKLRYVLTEISVQDSVERDIPVPDWDYLDGVQWIPDGSGLLVLARETSGSPFQIWKVAYPSGVVRRITQDFQDYGQVSISADSRLAVATQMIGNRNIWIGPLKDAQKSKQVTFGTAANDGFWGVAFMPDGRIVYTSPRGGNYDLWIMNADGSNQKQLTSNAGENRRPTVTPDGRYIFFQSDRGNTGGSIWRIDADGGNPKRMTDGPVRQDRPVASPDGQWIYFDWNKDWKSAIWKIPVEGGDPVPVYSAESVGLFAMSPDGTALAVERYEKNATMQWQQGIVRADSGEVVQWFDKYLYGPIHWTRDSKSLISLQPPNWRNLQQTDIDGTVNQLTNFDALSIRAFDISADGETLVVSRGNISYEAVLITNF